MDRGCCDPRCRHRPPREPWVSLALRLPDTVRRVVAPHRGAPRPVRRARRRLRVGAWQVGLIRQATKKALREAGLDPDDVLTVIRRGIEEDLGTAGDITSA